MLVGEKRLKELTAALAGVKLALDGDLGTARREKKWLQNLSDRDLVTKFFEVHF